MDTVWLFHCNELTFKIYKKCTENASPKDIKLGDCHIVTDYDSNEEVSLE